MSFCKYSNGQDGTIKSDTTETTADALQRRVITSLSRLDVAVGLAAEPGARVLARITVVARVVVSPRRVGGRRPPTVAAAAVR